jgi:5-methylcytosine-specific restriction enzyme subunit McrC
MHSLDPDSSMNTLELDEEKPRTFSEEELDIETVKILQRDHKEKISLDYSLWARTSTLKSNGYIGYIPVNENYVIRINPKVKVSNIFRMLEYAYKLESFELLKGLTKVESTEDFFENFVNILAKRVLERNRKGLYSDYVERSEPIRCLRGRMKILPTTISMLRGANAPSCEFEEHTSDLAENQILLWTLYQLRQFQINREDVRSVVRKAYFELIHKASLSQIEPNDCIRRFYSRLNQDYKPLHGLCRFFLEHVGPAIERGSYDFLPFVIYMPRLFESFVAEWLRERMPSEYNVKSQYTVNFDAEANFLFRIDLVVVDANTGENLCVLDTKYKTSSKPEERDIQQIFTYAATMETKHAFLVYPSAVSTPLDARKRGIAIKSMVFDTSKDPDEAGNLFLQQLINHLNSAE